LKKAITLIIIVLFCILLGLFIPYLLVIIKPIIEKFLGINCSLLPMPNYIQAVAALSAFFTATLISYSVYQHNLRKDKENTKESAYELVIYIEYSINNIESYTKKAASLRIEDKPADYAKVLYKLSLSPEEIETLKEVIAKIREISLISPQSQKVKEKLCRDFVNNVLLIRECQKIVAFLKRRFL
jgi:DNA-binding helix-hairpin-helix protein with protein kinase domain